jgi:hypothetical protein
MVEGTSLRFRYYDKNKGLVQALVKEGYDYVEVPPELAARSRYCGDMAWIDDDIGVVAIFVDPVTGWFYGQPT